MPRRILDRDEDLELDLRLGHIRRAHQHLPRLQQHLRALGAVGPHVREPAPSARGAVVKAWQAHPGGTAAHLYYLQHGKGEEGTDAPLYRRVGDAVDARAFAREALEDPHQFRFVVSVNDAHRINMQPFVQTLMKRVEADLQRPIEWVAATHMDTAHKHAHVVVRGRDARGKELYLFRQYLHYGLRARAREVATEFLGPVPSLEQDQEQARTQALSAIMDQHVLETKKRGGDVMEDDHTPPNDRNLDGVVDQPTTPSLDQPTLMQRLTVVLQQLEARQEARAQNHAQGIGL
jgi:type IV secretory pathway VirD2 relaxase